MNSIFFQACGKPVYALVSSVIRDIVCFVPLILVLPHFMGVEGVLYAAPAADLMAMLVTVGFTIAFLREINPRKQSDDPKARFQMCGLSLGQKSR